MNRTSVPSRYLEGGHALLVDPATYEGIEDAKLWDYQRLLELEAALRWATGTDQGDRGFFVISHNWFTDLTPMHHGSTAPKNRVLEVDGRSYFKSGYTRKEFVAHIGRLRERLEREYIEAHRENRRRDDQIKTTRMQAIREAWCADREHVLNQLLRAATSLQPLFPDLANEIWTTLVKHGGDAKISVISPEEHRARLHTVAAAITYGSPP